jgi:archaellum biogenesis protein FlaJ (TadC family)
MLNALGTRLARVIDRARQLQNRLEDEQPALSPSKQASISAELKTLRQRSQIINLATALMVICAALIGLTVMELFYSAGMAGRLQLSKWVATTFLGGFGFFITACMLYLAEILVASKSVKIGR